MKYYLVCISKNLSRLIFTVLCIIENGQFLHSKSRRYMHNGGSDISAIIATTPTRHYFASLKWHKWESGINTILGYTLLTIIDLFFINKDSILIKKNFKNFTPIT